MNNWKPSIYMFLSAFFYSLQYLDIKSISDYFGIWLITFFRGATSLIISLACLCISYKFDPELNILGKRKKLLLIRGFLGGLSIICSFLAVKNLNLSIATVILSTGPILTGIMSCYFKKDSWTRLNTFSLLICFSGLLIISIKGFKDQITNFFIGFFSGILSSLFTAMVNITINEIKDENTFTITLYSMSACIILTIPGLIYEITKENIFINNSVNRVLNNNVNRVFNITQLCLSGIFSFSAQYLKTRAIQISENLGIIILRYFDVVFCLLWDLFILKSKLYLYDYIGIALIFFGCFLNSIDNINLC